MSLYLSSAHHNITTSNHHNILFYDLSNYTFPSHQFWRSSDWRLIYRKGRTFRMVSKFEQSPLDTPRLGIWFCLDGDYALLFVVYGACMEGLGWGCSPFIDWLIYRAMAIECGLESSILSLSACAIGLSGHLITHHTDWYFLILFLASYGVVVVTCVALFRMATDCDFIEWVYFGE